MSGPIVLAAGGTGGHMIPAQALAGEFLARGRALALVTDQRGRDYGGTLDHIETAVVRAATPSGRSPAGRVRALAMVLAGTLQAARILARLRPAVVVGFGGYPSLPTMLAACRAGIPTLLHEQNAVLGRVNRLLAPWMKAIALSVAATRRVPSRVRDKARVTGNPVRPEIAAIGRQPYRAPSGSGPIVLLVFGGSQGAAVLSDTVPGALASVKEDLRGRLRVSQQCRPEDLESSRSAYSEADVEAELAPFFADLPARLGAAHLVIARAGASTIAELAAAGRPAILVPYPFATDDHQTAHARVLSDVGGAWLIADADLTAADLAARLDELLADDARLSATAAAAGSVARRDAAARLADLVEGIAAHGGLQ